MPTIEEKRVYAEQTGKTEVYVACGAGVVVVEVSDELVGGFGLEHQCTPRDIAAGGGEVAVATDRAVLALTDGEFAPTGFGPAAAVGFDGGDLLAADADGRVGRLPLAGDGTWTTVGSVAGDVRAIDGEFVAAATGVYRAGADEREGLVRAGLENVHDVSAAGVPLAAAADGLYKLGNGWMEVLADDFRAVASDGLRAHAATPGALYARAEEWHPVDLPVAERVRDADYTPTTTLAVTEAGTLLIESADGWGTRALGVDGVVGLAVR